VDVGGARKGWERECAEVTAKVRVDFVAGEHGLSRALGRCGRVLVVGSPESVCG